MTVETWDNQKCGDIRETSKVSKETYYYGFSSAAKAKNSDNEECYQRSASGSYVFRPDKVKFTFAYQEGRWVFKNVIRVAYNKPEILLSTALGYPVEPKSYREENKFWEDLVK